jgi:hypothetical protein
MLGIRSVLPAASGLLQGSVNTTGHTRIDTVSESVVEIRIFLILYLQMHTVIYLLASSEKLQLKMALCPRLPQMQH